jgi:glutathione reductase (NADPH)
MTADFDLFVIGAGSGGVRAARVAAGHGARVAIAEEHRVGGTCVIRGCVPKKLLVVGAHFAEDLEDAGRFGWTVGDKRFDWPVLRDHVLAEVARLSAIYQATLDSHGVATFHARAALADERRVRVGGEEVSAAHVLVATGARPLVPDIPGAEHGITSNEVFHLERLPQRALICGGGYIANEFAGIFHELGVEVTQLVRSGQLLRGWEPALAERLLAIAIAKGIAVRLNTRPERVERAGDGTLLVHCSDGRRIETDLLLWAVGRAPNSEALGLEAVGLATAAGGAIPVDPASHTMLPWLHAVGDVTDRVQLTPVAIREGHALADTLFGGTPWQVDHRLVPSAVFSHPPLASVGLTEGEARNRCGPVRVFTSDFRPLKNVLAGREERALYKLVVDAATDRVVGAHMIGPDAPEILQAVAIAVQAGLTKADFDRTVALHPTMAEELVLMR